MSTLVDRYYIEILLPTYNGEKYLKEQLDSIMNQSYDNWKLLIHDDNSIDSTLDIIDSYKKQYPEKIRLIDDEIGFGNASENFNYLLEYVTSEYVMFCDQDDVWNLNKVELTMKKMSDTEKKYGKDMPLLIHTDLMVVDEKLRIKGKSFWQYQRINPDYQQLNKLLMQNTVSGCTMMINQALFNLCAPLPKDIIAYDWWIALVASKFGVIEYVNDSTIKYRQHNANSIGAEKCDMKYVIDKLSKKNILDKNILQAKSFLKNFESKLDQDSKKMLEEFSTIENVGFIRRRMIVFKYKLFKHGLIRNIGLLIRI